MSNTCNDIPLIMAVLFLVFGLFVLTLGVAAWVRPQSGFVQAVLVNVYPREAQADPLSKLFGNTRERIGYRSIWTFRIIGPLFGALFAYIGGWLTLTHLHCDISTPDLRPLIGNVEVRLGLPMIPFIIFAGLLGLNASWKMAAPYRPLMILLAMCTAFAWEEAAAFHVGPQANRWAAISLVPFVLVGFVGYLGNRSKAAAK